MSGNKYAQGTNLQGGGSVIVLQPGSAPQTQGTVYQSQPQVYHPGFSNEKCGNITVTVVDAIVMLFVTTMGFVSVAEIADSSLDIMTAQAWMSVSWGVFSVVLVHGALSATSLMCCPMVEKNPTGTCIRRPEYPFVYQLLAVGGWVTVSAFLTRFYINYDNIRPASHFVGFNSLMFVFIIVALVTVIPFWYQTYKTCMCCAVQGQGAGEVARMCNCCSDSRGVYAQAPVYVVNA